MDKRLREKKAMEKERKLLDQEKQLYQARIRSEIRANLAAPAGLGCIETHPKIGVPPDREHYIHRLGRTGREGKDGEGILLLAPWEEYFVNELQDLPVEKCPLPSLDPDMNRKLEESLSKIDRSAKESAYHAWLGYYSSIREISRDKTSLAELANQFSESIGLQNAPTLIRKTALKMGLKDIPGIKIRK